MVKKHESPDIALRDTSVRRESLASSTQLSARSSSSVRPDNETEMFSGAASQIVPSSISKFHHHLRSPRLSAEGSSAPIEAQLGLLDENQNQGEDEGPGLEKVLTDGSVLSERARFRFFTPDEIEAAKGVSSLGRSTPGNYPEFVPVDYDTNWNTFEDDYDNDNVTDSETGHLASPRMSAVGNDSAGYGSTTDDNDEERGYLDRRRTYDVEDDLAREQENEDRVAGNLRKAAVECHDELFLPQFPAENHGQRFYLAEEDLVIGVAGYRLSKMGMLVYRIVCGLTLGLGYLVLRWLPRYRIKLQARSCALGKAEKVVIEDEFGLLDLVDVEREWYNKRISTFLSRQSRPMEEEDAGKPDEEDLYNPENDPVVPVMIFFEYRYMKFFYDPRDDLYKLSNNWIDERWHHYPDIRDGISEDTYRTRRGIFGENVIRIKEKSVSQLLTEEILHPFYAFQIFSIILWLCDSYYYYAGCIFIISVCSIMQSLEETRANLKRMRELALFKCTVRVWRNGFWKQISSQDLVPGDVYEVSDPSLSVFPCDSILLDGDCIVNESMLTGESVPVSKAPIAPDCVRTIGVEFTGAKFSPAFARSFLYNGTKIVRCRYGGKGDEPATALVVRTGFNTTKGALVRSMLFPKPAGFKFYEDSFKYIGVMLVVACVGFIFSIANFVKLGVETKTIILRALDIVTIVVPPALPATLTIGTSFALSRLRSKNIFCIAPTRLNIGGKLNVACFDKTGTLTEDGLDVLGVYVSKPISGRRQREFTEPINSLESLQSEDSKEAGELLRVMASCHSLKSVDGELIGDPLDEKMFEFTHWDLVEDPACDVDLEHFVNVHSGNPTLVRANSTTKLIQVKEFEFLSQLRRMSVVCQSVDNPAELNVFTKGAPEVLEEICVLESLPENFHDLLYHYTHSGFRVIACAAKTLKVKKSDNLKSLSELQRTQCESDLEFVGLIIFENRLKKGTAKALRELNDAGLRTIMCTGDNILTAISVSRKCGLIAPECKVYVASFNVDAMEDDSVTPPISWSEVEDPDLILDPVTLAPLSINQDENYCVAVTGDVFKYILTDLSDREFFIEKMLMKGAIFARMSPDEKHELVDQLKTLDYTVGFCGDGANDCGALKAADVGISLSEAEASVAAPFTSRVFEISCVLDVIKEGRASLVTSFSCFKYMSLYSAIQFVSVSLMYKEGVNLGDFQFLYIDLFLIIPIAVFMSWSGPFPRLCKKGPTANLISPKVLIPLLGGMVVEALFQALAWWIGDRPKEPWYVKAVPGNDDAVACTDNTVVYLFANFQYIFAAVLLTVGPPYRQPAMENVAFVATVFATTFFSVLLLWTDPDSWLGSLMNLTWLPSGIDAELLLCTAVNCGVLEFCNRVVFVRLARLYKKLFGRKDSKKKFKNLKREFVSLNNV